MAINEACQLWLEQQIPEGLEGGKSYRQIGRELSKEVLKMFEVYIKPETIRKRAERQSRAGTNVPPQSTPENDSENKDNQVSHGGKRKGAGPKPKHKKEEPLITPEFEKAFKAFLVAITNEKRLGWKTTSKEVALGKVETLYDVITIK